MAQKIITAGEIGDFVRRLYDAGIECRVEPKTQEITILDGECILERVMIIDSEIYKKSINEITNK